MRGRWEYSYTVLLLCWFGWISIYLCRSVLAPILPVLAEEMAINHAQGGMLETAYLVGYIAIKIPAGVAATRIGIKKTLIVGMIGYALCTALNFVASTFLHLLTLRFLVGLFQGVHLPLANTLLSERFGERQGKAIGFHESGPNVGNTIAYPLSVTIVSRWGWRYSFLLLSLPAFVLALVTTLILKEEDDDPFRAKGVRGSRETLMGFLSFLIPLSLAHAVYNLCLRSLLIFAPSYLVESKGMSLGLAGLISMLMPAAGFMAKVSSGFIAERVGERKAIFWASVLTGFFIGSLAYVSGDLLLAINFIVLGLALYSFSPVIYASVTSGLPPELKSIGLGVVTTIGNLFGALSTIFIGYLIDVEGYQATLVVISAITVVASLFIFLSMRSSLAEPSDN